VEEESACNEDERGGVMLVMCVCDAKGAFVGAHVTRWT
jgi:hypothetical protein